MKKIFKVMLMSVFMVMPMFVVAQGDIDPLAGTGVEVGPSSNAPLSDFNPTNPRGSESFNPILSGGATQQGPAGLIPCSGADCGFSDLIALANRIIQFLVFSVSIPLAALGFMFVGAKLVLNQNKEGAWSEAKQSFELIGMGFGIILSAFLLVKFVLYQFVSADYKGFLDFMFG